MKVNQEDSQIIIRLDSQTEADIMACCLNWGVSAMDKSKMIDTDKDDNDTREKCKVENDMWQEFCKVNHYHGDKPSPTFYPTHSEVGGAEINNARLTLSFPIDIKHPQVIAFAKAMDEVLCKNDHKGGWQECSLEYLEARLVEEMGEYFALIAQNQSYQVTDMNEYLRKKRKELVDIANFAMMLHNRS